MTGDLVHFMGNIGFRLLHLGKLFFCDLKRYWGYALYKTGATLRADVARARLGWIWWFLEPFCIMLFYLWVFSILLKRNQTYPSAYIYMGMASFSFFRSSVTDSLSLIRQNQKIISSMYIPKYILTLSCVLESFSRLLLAVPVIALLMLYYHVPLSGTIWYAIPVLALYFLFVYSICCVMTHFGVYYPGLKKLATPLFRALKYLSSVIFSFEALIQDKPYAWITELNPIGFFVRSIRECILYGESVSILRCAVWALVSTVILVIGIILIRKYENQYIKVV